MRHPETSPGAEVAPRPYFRTPALSPDGQTIAFSYAGDLWFVPLAGGEATLVTSHPAYDDTPRFSPDGTKLAFVSKRTGNGDLYVLSLDGGELRRLTFYDGGNELGDWAPDGQWLYFHSARDQLGYATYKVSVEGGTPIRVMGDPYESHYAVAVSPDGKKLAFNNNGDPWWRHGPNPPGASHIWIVSERCGANDFRRITDHAGRNRWPLWDREGRGLYFVSDRDGQENIWYQRARRGAKAEQITHFTAGRVLRPGISRDGRWIVFERDFGIWRLNLETRAAEPVDVRVRTDQKRTPITHYVCTGDLSEFALSPDAKKVAFGVRGKLFADFADKEDRPKNSAFPISDTAFREEQVAWSPDSKQVVYVSDREGDHQVYLYDFVKREETRLTDSPGPKHSPQFSPDGKWIAFAHFPHRISLIQVETKEVRPFVEAQFFFGVPGGLPYAWSPDSRWITFAAQDENYFTNLYVQALESGEAQQISFLSNISGWGPLWSPNGKFIVFTTGQYRTESQIARVDLQPLPPTFLEEDFAKLFEEEQEEKKKEEKKEEKHEEAGPSAATAQRHGGAQDEDEEDKDKDEEKKKKEKEEVEPVEIVLEGIQERLRFLTPPSLNATALRISPDSQTLIYRAAMNGKDTLWSRPLEETKREEPPQQLTSTSGSKWGVWFAADGKKLYYVDGGKIQYRKWPKGEPATLETRAEFDVDFQAEKKQMFQEAWRLLRDHYYDPTFNGLDWERVREQFYPLALGAQTSEDFREILNLMVGELNASHLGAYGGGSSVHDGYLGVTFDRAEQEAGRFKIASILPLGPVALAKATAKEKAKEAVKVGDYLLAVNGQSLGSTVNLDELLHRTVGHRITLTVNSHPDLEGAREVSIQPQGAGPINHLTYRHWVRENAAYVHRISGGRLGYAHVRSMSYEAFQQFLVDLDAEAHSREGVVVDVRFNGGGHIDSFLLDVLHRRSYLYSSYRGQARTVSTNLAGNRILDKPTIVVINEHSGSNTEMFTEGYRRLGLGKVVGQPTAGAVIWTWGWSLLDGTSFRLPRLQVTTLEGENLEGAARHVDYEVERPLGEAAQGKDSQLDVAVEKLLEAIDAT